MANYVLEILDGDRAGEVLPVADRTMRIGRKPGNDIVLPDEKTSGVHCEIAPEGDRLVLKDLGSTNGTFLDDKRVTEIVLSPGDVVKIGRTMVKFRAATGAGGESQEFAVRQLDAGRLKRRGGSLGPIAVLLVLGLGAGGLFWWQGQEQGGSSPAAKRQKQEPLLVSGNLLVAAAGNCEAEEGWDLRAAGLGFQSTATAHTGTGAFAAVRASVEAGAENAGVDFAVMRLAKPMQVAAGRSLGIAAHCRTTAGAMITVRARVFSQNEQVPFTICNGLAMASYEDGWQRVETSVLVPSGCDQLQLEVVALLPSTDAEAMVDDLAVVAAAAVAGVDVRPQESGQTAFGFGASLAVRSPDADNPATVLGVLPDAVPAAMQELHRAGLCVLSDLGATLTCTPLERSFAIAASGVDSLAIVLPAEAADALMVAEKDGRFRSVAAASDFPARSVLVGSHATRAQLRFDADTAVRGKTGGGVYRLAFAATSFELVLGFRAERQLAVQRLHQAELARKDGKPGAALDELNELLATAPMESIELARAQAMRSELLVEQADRLRQLQKELEDARFFSTRGGFERVQAGVQTLVDLYGERNLEDLEAARQLLAAAQDKLIEIDRQQQKLQRDRLTMLADAFGASQQSGMQQLVQQYIERNLSAEAKPPGPGGPDDNKPRDDKPGDNKPGGDD